MKTRPLDNAFWDRFARENWERKPMALRRIASPLAAMDQDEIFRLLVLYADQCRKKASAEGFKFFIDGHRIHEDEVLDLLPEKSDRTLLGYHERMNEIFEDYCLVCDELLRVNHDKHELLSAFTAELYRHVGFPNRFAEMGLYLGNYRKTPFGVHVDKCGVFTFPIAGKKKFRLWEPDYVAKHPELVRAHDYRKHKANSELLEGEPGDLTYWPSSLWHIAESDGSFTAAWSLGVWVDRTQAEMAESTVARLLASRLGNEFGQRTIPFKTLHDASGEIRKLPKDIRKSLAVARKLKAKDFETAFFRDWLVHISKEGFKTPPQARPTPKITSESILRRAHAPLLWHHPKGASLLVAFAGTVVEVPNKTKHVLKLIESLNEGLECVVGDYLKGSTVERDLECVAVLAGAGAFR